MLFFPATSAGDVYGAGRTLDLKQHIHLWLIPISCKCFCWLLETMSHKRKILCCEPCLGLLCSAGHWVLTWCQGQQTPLWQTPEIFPPWGRRQTHSPPPSWSSSSCCFRNPTDLWLRRPKKEPFLPNVVSGQSCAPITDDSEHLGCLKSFDFWKKLPKLSEIVKLSMAAYIIYDLH